MCSNLFKICSNVFKYVQICSNMFKYVQTCSNLFKTCSNVIKWVKICSKLFQMSSNMFKWVNPNNWGKIYQPFQCKGSDMTSRAWSSFSKMLESVSEVSYLHLHWYMYMYLSNIWIFICIRISNMSVFVLYFIIFCSSTAMLVCRLPTSYWGEGEDLSWGANRIF